MGYRVQGLDFMAEAALGRKASSLNDDTFVNPLQSLLGVLSNGAT